MVSIEWWNDWSSNRTIIRLVALACKYGDIVVDSSFSDALYHVWSFLGWGSKHF